MWVSVRQTRRRDQLAASVSLRWFPVRELGKVYVYISLYSFCLVFFFHSVYVCNTCVMRSYGNAGSLQEACRSDPRK